MGEDDTDNYNCTSWCRFSFYEANFGWGKPSWVSTPSAQVKNVIILLDTKDGDGIEAFLSFKEEDMVVIETNKLGAACICYSQSHCYLISIEKIKIKEPPLLFLK